MSITADQELMFKKFVDQGNVVIGRPAKIQGTFRISEYLTGTRIQFGTSVTLRNCSFKFPMGGGELKIGDHTTLRSLVHIGPKSKLTIGNHTVFNRDCELHAWEAASIKIGDACLFSNIKIRTSDMHSIYDLATKKRVNFSRDVFVGNKVWVAEGAVLGKGSHIEDGSVIGSYSFVTGHIESNCIAAGTPAKIVRKGIYWERAMDMNDPIAMPSKFNPEI